MASLFKLVEVLRLLQAHYTYCSSRCLWTATVAVLFISNGFKYTLESADCTWKGCLHGLLDQCPALCFLANQTLCTDSQLVRLALRGYQSTDCPLVTCWNAYTLPSNLCT